MNPKIEINTSRGQDQEALDYFAANPDAPVFVRNWRPEDETSRAKVNLRRRQAGWMTMVFRKGEVVKVRPRPLPGVVLTSDNMGEAMSQTRFLFDKIIQAVLSARPESAKTVH